MPAFKSVLYVSIDAEQDAAALKRLRRVVDAHAARLTVMSCVEEPSALQKLFKRSDRIDELVTAARISESDRLGELTKKVGLTSEGVIVESGNPLIPTVQQVLRAGHDLVAIGAGTDEEHQVLLKRLLRKCPAPMWIIRPTRARKLRVMAAVNPEPDEVDLNLDILTTALGFHDIQGGDLHVVHAWQRYGEDAMRSSAFIQVPAEDIEAMLAEEMETRSKALEELLADDSVADAAWQRHLTKGRPADAVVKAVDKNQVNLLVLGTVARTGVPGLIMGNTAESILDRVSCSILAVKPEGFVSPIGLDPAR